jgi:CubicO group peptidase (beta-lactamase class C family)
MKGMIVFMRMQLLCLVLTIGACSPSAMADPASTPPLSPPKDAQHLEAGTPASTPAGTVFTVPTGWTMTTKGLLVVLSPPEPDLKVALVDIEAKDAADAAAAGWAAFDPGFRLPLDVELPQRPRNGWTDRHFFRYQASPSEKLEVTAFVLRAGNVWQVGLIRGGDATSAKRKAEINLIQTSLRPKGYQPETFAGRTEHPIDAHVIQVMKDFVADGMKRLGVPGAAFSLIDHGRVVYVGGLGVRELGRSEPVNADTLFPAASNTKAFTTLLLAELVDQKKLRWDEPVIEAYPAFKLGDAASSSQAQIRHLVCSCTHIPNIEGEWAYRFRKQTPATIMQLVGSLQPTSRFGEGFQYSNLMQAAAGYVAGSVAEPGKELGTAYDEAMGQMVLRPLGMKRSTFDFAKAMQGNYARPHDVDFDGRIVLSPMGRNYSAIAVRPAGGLWTSANDLSKYVMMELAKGRLPDGTRLVSENNLAQRQVPNAVEAEGATYGMGLRVDKHWGVTVVDHGGDVWGYHADMMWLPDYGVGAVILTNGDQGNVLVSSLMRKLLEQIFVARPEADQQLEFGAQRLDIERKQERQRLQIPADPDAVKQLAVNYRSEELGDLVVRRTAGNVDFDLVDGWNSAMATRKNDDGTVSFVGISPTQRGWEFVVGDRGGKRLLVQAGIEHDWVFAEQNQL